MKIHLFGYCLLVNGLHAYLRLDSLIIELLISIWITYFWGFDSLINGLFNGTLITYLFRIIGLLDSWTTFWFMDFVLIKPWIS